MTFSQMSLAMDTGIASTVHTSANVTVEQDFYVHRILPFITVQTVRVTFSQEYLSNDTAPPPQLFHEVVAPSATHTSPTFTTNNLVVSTDIDVSMLCCACSAYHSTASTSATKVAAAVSYLFDKSIVRNAGHNVYRTNRGQAFNRLDFFDKAILQPGKEYRVHVVTAMASSNDFADEDLLESLQRMILNFVSLPISSNSGGSSGGSSGVSITPISNSISSTSADDIATDLRARHVAGWMALWSGSNVLIEPKDGVSSDVAARVLRVRRAARSALYHVQSSTRPGTHMELNPGSLELVDRNGSIVYDGDLFFIPFLLLMNPDLARAPLQHRYASLAAARQLAAGFGNRGAKFPYVNDAVGASKSLYWDTVSPVAVFNTPLVAVSAWNYYRATRDFDWLKETGYDILRGVADYIVSIAEPVADPGAGGPLTEPPPQVLLNIGGYVNGPSGRVGRGNVFTNYLSATALRYAIEASYELGASVKTAWHNVYSAIRIAEYADAPDILRFDDAVPPLILPEEADEESEEFAIAEPLLLLTPYFSELYFDGRGGVVGRDHMALYSSLDAYSRMTSPGTRDHPWNLLARALVASRVAQSTPLDTSTELIERYETCLTTFLDAYSDEEGSWGALSNLDNNTTTTTTNNNNNNNNDVMLSAIFLLMILMGPVGMRIQGGVTDTRFYYQDMQVVKNVTARMPSSWKRIVLHGFGSGGRVHSSSNSNSSSSNTLAGYAGYAGVPGSSAYQYSMGSRISAVTNSII
jgi:hypothetical protein